ncbi:MAG: hypothetical protein ACQESR_21075 [Planctomycetota bacterium]
MPFQRKRLSRPCGRTPLFWHWLLALWLGTHLLAAPDVRAGALTVVLKNSKDVARVGVVNRWDRDGNPRAPVDPKAKISAPRFTATATRAGPGRWVFSDLPPATYDLIILLRDRVRIEGFHYPPVLEFDEFLEHEGNVPPDVRETIESDIAQSRHYENKVTPLYMSGNEKRVRVLVQLLRDKPTSYDGQYGEQVATLRHEVWQFTNNYGGWAKEKRTRVLDRVLMGKAQLRQWTWVWTPRLGGVDVGEDKAVVKYTIPEQWNPSRGRGW